MEKLRLIIMRLGKFMDVIAGVIITIMILLTVADVVFRYFGMPILGTYEIVSLGGALAIGISSLFTYWERCHIRVEFVVANLPKKTGHILGIISRAMIVFIIGWAGLNLIVMGYHFFKVHEVTLTLHLPSYPVIWAVGICFLIVSLAALYELISGGGDRQ